jgi:hypothetical protein
MSPSEADQTAIKLMGAPALLAEDLIRRESGIEAKPAWRVALLPVAFIVVAQLAVLLISVTGAFSFYWVTEWLNYGVLASFVWAVWRSKRWLISPMAVALVACSLAWGLAFILVPASAWFGKGKAEALADYARQLRSLEKELLAGGQVVSRGTILKGNGPYHAPIAAHIEGTFSMPYVPFTIRYRDDAKWYSLQEERSLAEAQKKWQENGPGYLAHLRKEIQITKEGQTMLTTDSLAHRIQNVRIAPVAINLSYQLVFLTAVNAGVLLLAARRRQRKANTRLTA